MKHLVLLGFVLAVTLVGCDQAPIMTDPSEGRSVKNGDGLQLWDLDVKGIRTKPGTNLVIMDWSVKTQSSLTLPRKVVFTLECLGSKGDGDLVVMDQTSTILSPNKPETITASFEMAKELSTQIVKYKVSAQTIVN